MTVDVVYTAESTASGGGRTGHVTSAEGTIDFDTSPPAPDSQGRVNPEMLFSAGYAACFLGALRKQARVREIDLADEATVTAKIGFGKHSEGGFGLTATLEGFMPGVDSKVADELMAAAHQNCPYSKATRGNIDVSLVAKT